MSQEPRAAGARAPGVHGSERAEPTTFAHIAHRHANAWFAPWLGSNEAALRQRIRLACGLACAAARRSIHSRARALYWMAADIASERVVAALPSEELWATIHSVARL